MSAAFDLAVRALVLLMMASLAAALLRHRPASLRAFVWTVALGGLLLLPVVSLVTPEWRVEVWSAPAPVPAPPSIDAVRMSVDPMDAPPLRAAQRTRLDGRVSDVAPAPIATQQIAAARVPLRIDWSALALAFTTLVTVVLFARIAISHARMARIVARAVAADAAWAALVSDVRGALGIRRAVPVRITGAVNVPAIVGVFRPSLLLPADAGDWPADMRRAVVLHELAHVARWDSLSQLVSQIACAVYWCIPLVWHGARRAAALRERASDDHVLRAGVRASTYADSLIGLARLARGGDLQAAVLSMARPSRMRERVVAILDPEVRRDAPPRRTIGVIVMAASAAIAALAAVQPAAARLEAAAIAETIITTAAPTRPLASDATIAPPAKDAAAATTPATASAAADIVEASAVPTEAPASEQAPRICSGKLDQSSTSINDDDNGKRSWKITLSGGGCKVELRTEGKVEFNPDFTDIASVGSNGFFRLDVSEGGNRRQLDIESRNGSLTREWRVNGREQPYDAAARAWLADFLIELDRRTAVGVEVRLPQLMKQGGVDAVLKETSQIKSDYARGKYYERLTKETRLSTADVTRILQQAAPLTESDHYAHSLIAAFAGRGITEDAQRDAVSKLIEGMESDHYRAESIALLVSRGPVSAGEMDFLLRMIPRMDSDHYQLQVLTHALKGGRMTTAQQVMLTAAASSIESDHYAAEFMKAIVASGPAAPPAQAMLRHMPSIESDHYRTEIFGALLSSSQLSEADLLGIVSAADGMSGHYAAETLRGVLRHRAVTDRVRTAVLRVADGLSRHYADEVRRAAGVR
ncbi:MAG: M56 family metallopeptidase [Acidobacteriota bacterium]|nr:M56 family metallopeptidase [Acidobacteriota bacterium]